MGDRLDEYRRKRDRTRTPEPVPEPEPAAARPANRFVIQQHHARALHWDLRLERDGVLASWAVPRGLPREPGRSHLAVHTEDHPLEYLEFSGEIPAGEYGGGRMTVFDRGDYTCEKWRDDEVLVALRGGKVSGRYVLFRTARGGESGRAGTGRSERDWMVRRLDPAPPGWQSMPERVRPMRATTAAKLPADDAAWGYEMRWDGLRAIGYVSGGRLRLRSGDDDLTPAYPQLRELAEALAPTEAVLDGELVSFDRAGRVRPAAPRSAGQRPPARDGSQYLIFDLLWLEGTSSLDLPYAQRRELLDGLALSGPHWQTPPYFPGGGRYALDASREQGLAGVLAKRLDAGYLPGRRSRHWLVVDN
ncbi:DNA polymerase ligase N-terminal domain-containing protein [Plantactinospora sp. KLBMP9567]|uniref:DNA polymerase ligase N-terminal domain-containing protein n=1 Tax=Plantactinospora sp. KLBMP9567 TaxID=3085900 RepID=UPI002982B196|nr:DNA polymerase ligase N-terminal domain-containing protein [Plantactinospora sp. KLBMP9567]MDW5329767.1 DNA polymerase ligase N-terminal domain-containing protein [Plantactinospora sp. KLBMP9567]